VILPLCPAYALQLDRAEAASLLERRLAAMEALLTARRQMAAAAVVAAAPVLPDFMQPPPTVSCALHPPASCSPRALLQHAC
jgi:hypothetical protein